jgi:GNAT superfamily N-acetyltransferase
MTEFEHVPELEIREISLDSPDIQEQQWAQEADTLFRDTFMDEDDEEAIYWDENYHVYIACSGLQLVSAINVKIPEDGQDAYVYGIATTPESEWRNKKIGAALMQHAISVATEKGCANMRLTPTESAKPFYRRLHFVPANEPLTPSMWTRPLRP